MLTRLMNNPGPLVLRAELLPRKDSKSAAGSALSQREKRKGKK